MGRTEKVLHLLSILSDGCCPGSGSTRFAKSWGPSKGPGELRATLKMDIGLFIGLLILVP